MAEPERRERREWTAFRVVFDLVLASLGAIGIFLYKQLGKNLLTQTGFHCADESLSYPYKHSTIPAWLNGLVGVAVPVLIIAADHFVKAAKKVKIDRRVIIETLLKMFPIVVVFAAGCGLQHIFTDIAKYQIGRLRPHFFDVCEPKFLVDGETVDCASGKVLPYLYIEKFTCNSSVYPVSRQREARLSFPSGHCSFAFFAMTFAFIYILFRLPRRFASFCGTVPRPLLHFACLWWAWFVAISRLFDNKHHASDIIAGSLIGVLNAIFFAIFGLGLHRTEGDEEEEEEKDEEGRPEDPYAASEDELPAVRT